MTLKDKMSTRNDFARSVVVAEAFTLNPTTEPEHTTHKSNRKYLAYTEISNTQ